MKLKFDRPLLDLNGNPIQENGTPVTLRSVALAACAMMVKGDDERGPEEKTKIYRIMQRLKAGKNHFSVDQMAVIKTRIGFAMPVGYAGPALDMIDPPKDQGGDDYDEVDEVDDASTPQEPKLPEAGAEAGAATEKG